MPCTSLKFGAAAKSEQLSNSHTSSCQLLLGMRTFTVIIGPKHDENILCHHNEGDAPEDEAGGTEHILFCGLLFKDGRVHVQW